MMNNKKSRLLVSLILALTATMVFSAVAFAAGRGPGYGAGLPTDTPQATADWRGRGGGGVAQTPLTEAEVEALNLVLQDEYHAWAVYDQVIQDFGEVVPFAAIRDAESRHADAVGRLFTKYGLEIPENEWIGQVPSFDSVADACAAAAQAEIDNADLYDTVLASTDKWDLTRVFTNLQSASLNQHLPVFEDCAQ